MAGNHEHRLSMDAAFGENIINQGVANTFTMTPSRVGTGSIGISAAAG
jgi:hypothetical protein